MKDFVEIIQAWPAPSIRSFADDIGVEYVTAQMMKHRNSISPEYWSLIVEAASDRGIHGVTLAGGQRETRETPSRREAFRSVIIRIRSVKRSFPPASAGARFCMVCSCESAAGSLPRLT